MLPLDGRHLVVGGPGTGKSVVAMLRARRHHRAAGGQGYVFLVYNRLLLEASRELVDGVLNADTWIARFKAIYRHALARPCPTGDAAYAIDWEQVTRVLQGLTTDPRPPVTPYLVIDEGQDMPPAFYQTLVELGFENFYVVADQNQQITEHNSSLHDIETRLVIDTADRVELTENYRNCDRVARLALAFCVPDPATPAVAEPSGRPCRRTPVLVDYGPACRWDFPTIVRRLLKLADRGPHKLIGLFTPNDRCRRRWVDALRRAATQPDLGLDRGPPRVATYSSREPGGDHRFGEGGIFVINAQSAKGLEFDTLLLADIDQYPCHPEDPLWMDSKRRLFYVMVSRAREQVILLRQADRPCPIEAILPTDQTILRRWR